MRYLLLSDVHGNWEAFKAVLGEVKNEKFDRVIFLGDIVGYGADPQKCCEQLKKLEPVTVMGNHDAAVLRPELLSWFNHYARLALEWTAAHLSKSCLEYLASFPVRVKFDDITAVHSNPYKPESWEYILSKLDALFYIKKTSDKIILFGHTHIPVIYEYDGESVETIQPDGNPFKLDIGNKRYMLNPGSVGQPRDNDPRAAYGILDTDEMTFVVKRVEYDVEKAARKIIDAGLPRFLGERLYTGE